MPETETRGWRAASALLAAAGALALAGALASARASDWTYDEPHHLEYSERLWERDVSERASAERFNSKTPISLANVLAMRAARAVGVRAPRDLLFAARLPTVAALALLIAATWTTARWLLGARAAAFAAAGVALDPSLIGHGSLITVDVPYALGHLATLGLGVWFRRRPTTTRALALGMALGFALAAKFTGLLLLPGLALVAVVRPEAGAPRPRAAQVLALGAATLGVLCAAYLASELFKPLGAIPFTSAPFRAIAERFPGLALPVPAAFLSGIDQSVAADRSFRPILAFGRRFEGGTPWYFVGLWLLKTPLLLLVAQAAGLAGFARAAPLRGDPALRFLALNLLLALGFFSFYLRTQLGYRYALACIPLGWLLAAAGLSRSGRKAELAFLGAALGAAVEIAGYWGNPLSFTNALLWPKRDAYRLMADSNLDWGQNNDKIRREMAARGLPLEGLDPVHLLPGVNVIPLNTLAGVVDWERHRYVRERLAPGDHIRHTHLVYEAAPQVFEEFLSRQRSVTPWPWVRRVCPEGGAQALLGIGGSLPFRRSSARRLVRNWILCVDAPEGADISFELAEGRARFGRYEAGACRFEWLSPPQQAWHRLLPGRHAFCAEPIATDTGPPVLVRGSISVRRGRAALELRPDPQAPPRPAQGTTTGE